MLEMMNANWKLVVEEDGSAELTDLEGGEVILTTWAKVQALPAVITEMARAIQERGSR